MTAALLSFLAAVLLPQDALPPPSGFWERGTMLGDLGGVRTTLADHGVTTALAFTGEILSNVDGGRERETSSDLLMDWVIDADFHRAFGWTGASARVNPLWLAGTGISDDIGDLTRVSNIAGRGGVRVFEAWLQQNFFNNVFSLRAGILASDQEFAISNSGLLYYNSVFGSQVFIGANFAYPIYPVGAPGARARIDLARNAYVQAAVYDGDPGTEAFNRSGLRVRLKDGDGLFSIAEAGLILGETLPGALKAGWFHHSADFGDHSGLHGGYVVVEQKLCREVPAVDVFARFGIAREDRSFVSAGLDAGVNVTGLIPGRPADVLGIGAIYARVSRAFARSQPDRPLWGHESVVELTYKVALTPWLSLQPDLQYIVHPGGSSAIANATVIGLRVDVLF